jgi:hypothetical protein
MHKQISQQTYARTRQPVRLRDLVEPALDRFPAADIDGQVQIDGQDLVINGNPVVAK